MEFEFLILNRAHRSISSKNFDLHDFSLKNYIEDNKLTKIKMHSAIFL